MKGTTTKNNPSTIQDNNLPIYLYFSTDNIVKYEMLFQIKLKIIKQK